MRVRTFARLSALALIVAAASALPIAAIGGPQQADSAQSLLNPGFEDGPLGAAPQSWTVASAADSVTVTDTDGPADFATYAEMGNVVVEPNRGDQMLRLGTPKRGSENQNRGVNSVSQTFVSSETSLRFAFRLFSWEHRGNDLFGFDVRSATGSVGTLAAPVVVTMADGSTRTCATIPCSFTLDVGGSGQYVDSGWQAVEVSGLPVGESLTLSYSAGGTSSESHATWAYFDDVELPGVAKFSFAFVDPLEGDIIQFTDRSFHPDPSLTIEDWDWTIDGESYDAQNPIAIIADEGTYEARLRITMSDGSTAEIAAGETAADGTAIPPLTLTNAAPLAGALNVEAHAGVPAPLLARFADQGWEDAHTATWSVAGASGATVEEDNLAFLSTGAVTGSITTATDASGSVRVQDADGGEVIAGFDVTVVPDDPERHEPNAGVVGAQSLNASGSYLSYIQSAGDVDIFEVRLPNGAALTPGAEVLVTLRDLPADFDLALLATNSTNTGVNALEGDSGQVGFETAAYARGAYARGAYARGAYARGAYARGAYARGAYARGAFQFSNIPLSDLGYTGYDGEQIGGTDITLDELGLGDISASGVELAGFSANRGLDNDTALARIDKVGTRLYVAVTGPNGSFSTAAYRLQIEASVTLDLEEVLGSEVCTGTPLVTTGATSGVTTLFDYPGAATSLIVTQRERMRTTHNMDDAAWADFLADLVELASQPTVQADVISLPSTTYDAWDIAPCSIDAANAVANAARDEIQSRLNGIQNVVVAGGDNIVPHLRVPDETIISNERDYVLDSFTRPGSPLFASIIQGFNLTDDHYVDASPTDWQGRKLYLPDLPIGRLVETPDDIRATTDAYVASQGLLSPQTARSFGYDFFSDGAGAVADNLSTKLSTTSLINEIWTADDLRCQFLGQDIAGLTGCNTTDVAALNAHFTHYGAYSANGFNNDDLGDFLGSNEVAASPLGGLVGSVVFTMGCHAGLNVPDGDSEAPDPGLGIDPALDYPQAMAMQQAILIASTGYGLGETEGLAGTEKLLEIFSRELVDGGATAGGALVRAKQDYILEQAAPTVYDEKSTIQTVFYGLPMYSVRTPVAPAATASLAAPAGDVTVNVDDGGTPTNIVVSRELETVADGQYYLAGGEYQATAGRPIQPKAVIDVPNTGTPVKDVVVWAAAYTDITQFDPVIARPTTEWEDGATEPQSCIETFWPAMIARLNSLDIGGVIEQKLVLTTGQFRCTSGNDPTVTGTERLYDDITTELLRCPAGGERVAPLVRTVDLRRSGADVLVTVDTADASGIDRIVVLRIFGGLITPVELDLNLETTGIFTVTIPNAAFGENYIVQVQDGACNVAVATGKGVTLNAVGVDAGPDQVIVPNTPNTFTSRIEAYGTLVPPVSYAWDFGDGETASAALGPGDITLAPDGSASFTVQHAYDPALVTPVLAVVRVTDSAGGVGTDSAVVALDDDLDDDGVLNDDDGCPTVFDPLQENRNGETLLLPKPVPVYNDATNPAADGDGDACDIDQDGDGLDAADELARFLSPFVWDTDGDRTNDGTEVACGSDPLLPISNLSGPDSDLDRLPDACEAVYGTDPEDSDSDNDGVLDGVEVRYWMTDPLVSDTDGDGCRDDHEVATINGDRAVNATDLSQVAMKFGFLTPEFRPFDSNGDGAISAIDLSFTAQRFTVCPPR